jgi:hypothetical protein
MNHAWKYANRYGYPDADVIQEIAKHHGVKPENVLLTPGSGEVLEIVRYRCRPRAAHGLHVVRHNAIIVIRPKRGVIVGRTGRETLIVMETVAGDIVENLQISCEVGNYLNEAR